MRQDRREDRLQCSRDLGRLPRNDDHAADRPERGDGRDIRESIRERLVEEVEMTLQGAIRPCQHERQQDRDDEGWNDLPFEDQDHEDREDRNDIGVVGSSLADGGAFARNVDGGQPTGATVAQIEERQHPCRQNVHAHPDRPIGQIRRLVFEAGKQFLECAELNEVDERAGADPHREHGRRDMRWNALAHHDRQRDDADRDRCADTVH